MSDERVAQQLEALKKVVETIASRPVKHGRHGEPGRDGRPGPQGPPGRDVDPMIVDIILEQKVNAAVAQIPIPKDGAPGADGKDVPLDLVEQLVDAKAKEYVAQIPVPLNGKDGETVIGPPGPRGIPGPKGGDGEIGAMPRHEWESTRLRFEIEPGKWGKFTELRGPKGERGDSGALTAMGLPMGGGGGGSSSGVVTNGWFPMGWN